MAKGQLARGYGTMPKPAQQTVEHFEELSQMDWDVLLALMPCRSNAGFVVDADLGLLDAQDYTPTMEAHGVLPSLGIQPNGLRRIPGQSPSNSHLSEAQQALQASILNSPAYANVLEHSMPSVGWFPGSPPWAASYPAFPQDASGYCQQPTPYAFEDQYYSNMTTADELAVDPAMLQNWPSLDSTYNSVNPRLDGAAMVSFAHAMPSILQGQECLEEAIFQVGGTSLAPCSTVDYRTLNKDELSSSGYDSLSPASKELNTPVSTPRSLDSNAPHTPSSQMPQTSFNSAILDKSFNRQTAAPPRFRQIVDELASLGDSLHSNAQKEMAKVLNSYPMPITV
ncbi:hypothetical protein GGR57DRAFT_500450 [Xylariaceae sp. FL1272]|nr:hypothetical protein GGR57DRAFT_500450 [Xylariaceae sp. FL1272]